MNYIPLDLTDLAIASVLVLVNGAMSLALRLGVAKQLLIASVRMVVNSCSSGLS